MRTLRRDVGRSVATALAALALLVGGVVAAGCGDDDDGDTASTTTTLPDGFGAERCLVRLHGKSETGADPVLIDGVAELSPTGNDGSGAGHQWLYFPDDRYDEAVGVVSDAVTAAGCERVVVDGFSNGGAFAATLACRGETFGGTLVGVVVDDPPPDEGTVDCTLGEGVEVVLYWTGALTEAEAGVDCDDLGWVCLGGRLVGIDAYARSLGVEVRDSPHEDHTWFRDAPEITTWLGDAG